MKTIVHVNQGIIRSNKLHSRNAPPLTARNNKKVLYGHQIVIHDTHGAEVARIVYNGRQLSCGARCWIETTNDVSFLDPDGNFCEGIKYADAIAEH